jgi:two-component system sensor histidine kinase RpfC
MGGAIGFSSQPGNGTTFWFTIRLSQQSAEAHEHGTGEAIRDARLSFVSSRPAADEWLAKAARERHFQYASFMSIEDAITVVRHDGNRELCMLVVDGEDGSIRWRDAPDVVRREGAQLPCILIHPDVSEIDAFDAGYACLLKFREPRLLERAIRSVVAGSSSLQSLADFSWQQIPGRTRLHILVAEDNQISQQIIAKMLQAGGHRVTLVSDGESVLEDYQNASFDVIILDMHMPGRTGLEVARAIRLLQSERPKRRVPIIMLTAAASTDLREDSLDAGIDLFLSKPVDLRGLLRGVNKVFSEADHVGAVTTSNLQTQKEYIDHVLLQDTAALVGDSRFIQTLTHTFTKNARQLVDQIEAAVIQKDYERFRELTHSLKGAAMMAGAIRLRDSAIRVEDVADSDFNSINADTIEELRGTLEATSRELSRIVT